VRCFLPLFPVDADSFPYSSHLIAKTYSLEITEDEKKARDALNASIRADMGLLNQKIATVGLEINYSRFSMADYGRYVQSIRSIQRGLITAYSSLAAMEVRLFSLLSPLSCF
jgi:hypothetical protein